MTREEERMFIAKAQEGDTAAFEALLIANQKFVYNLACKIAGNEEEALDISQEVFLKAYTGLKTFRGESRLSVWLYKITYNISIDFKRKKNRENAVSLVFPDDGGEPSELEIPDNRFSPESVSEKRELAAAIEKAVDQLRPDHRQIFILREFSDMSYEDIASALSISEGTVKSRLSRARQQLAKILTGSGTFRPAERPKSRKEDGFDE